MAPPPRIYNLFPLLAGTTRDWARHLPRIAAMNFDWVYLNPVHYPGFSGSLYAVKDPEWLHPLFQGDSDESPDKLLAAFVAAAEAHGLKVMLDLVINHTAKDAVLAEQRPDWYVRAADGSLHAPGARDDSAPEGWVTWGDLAELDYTTRASREGLTAHWSRLVERLVRLGVKGFRCDAAYQVPAEVWRGIIAAAERQDAEVVFAAETLGCTPDQVAGLASAGFTYIFNSAKWWDFDSTWLLTQYEAFRHIAPSIAFPESHDTPRLIDELGLTDDPRRAERVYKQRYAFAAAFATGVMMPVGFEYGFARKLDVVMTRPDWWETPRFDLGNFIAEVNAAKVATPALATEGRQLRLTEPGADVVALLRYAGERPSTGCAVTLVNRSLAAHTVESGWLIRASGGEAAPLRDITPASTGAAVSPDTPLALAAESTRLLAGPPAGRGGGPPAPGSLDDSAYERLAALAESRVTIAHMAPGADGDGTCAKACAGDLLPISALITVDGDTVLRADLAWQDTDDGPVQHRSLGAGGAGWWRGALPLSRSGLVHYRLHAWIDPFATWRRRFTTRRRALQAGAADIADGLAILQEAVQAASGPNRAALTTTIRAVRDAADFEAQAGLLMDDRVAERVAAAGLRHHAVTSAAVGRVRVERSAARLGRWYRLAPWAGGSAESAAFGEAVTAITGAQAMGFDTILLGPAGMLGGDAGSAPLSEAGLGELVDAVHAQGLAAALDVRVGPADFYGADCDGVWCDLRDSFVVWVERGVRLFRIARPGDVPLPVWQWVLGELLAWRPDILVIAGPTGEPGLAAALARAGFAQVELDTPFTALGSQRRLAAAMATLAEMPGRAALRSHLRVDAPVGTASALHTAGYPAFMVRAALAALLAPAYSIYEGFEVTQPPVLPAPEALDVTAAPRGHGPRVLTAYLGQLNAMVMANPALQAPDEPVLPPSENDRIAWFGRWRPGGTTAIFVAVTMDPDRVQAGRVALPLARLGLHEDAVLAVEELFSGNKFHWQGRWQAQRLDPLENPAAVFRITLPDPAPAAEPGTPP